MKRTRKQLHKGLCVIALLLSHGASAFQMGSEGKGGHTICSEFYKIMINFNQYASKNEEKIQESVFAFNKNKLRETLSNFKCLPYDGLFEETNRQALSGVKEIDGKKRLVTEIDPKEWRSLSWLNKIKLTTHEIFVLMEIENDLEHVFSNHVFKLAFESGAFFDNFGARKIQIQGKETIFFIYPYWKIGGKKHYIRQSSRSRKIDSYQGICSFLGIKRFVSGSQNYSWDEVRKTEKTVHYVDFSTSGKVRDRGTVDAAGKGKTYHFPVIDSVSCIDR